MRYSIRQLILLGTTPLGRRQFREGLFQSMWPLLEPFGRLYRKTVLRHSLVAVIVGSLGKTTTSRALHVLMDLPPDKNFHRNFRSHVIRSLFRASPKKGRLVVEAGIDGPGQMIRYARLLTPGVTVFTAVAHEHIRSLYSLDNILNEKADMIRCLPRHGFAILNGDDPHILSVQPETVAPVITYGMGDACSVRASDVVMDWPEGMRLTLHTGKGTYRVRTHLVGRHMIYPFLAAVASGLALGMEPALVLKRLDSLQPVCGRMQPVVLKSGTVLLRDEFKSTLESVHRALDTLSEIPAKNKIVIMGEISEPPGQQGPIYREIGGRIARVATQAVFMGGNFQRYASGAASAGMQRRKLTDGGRRPSTVIRAVPDTGPDTVILIKGRFSQKMERVSLALMGRPVRCDIPSCHARSTYCDTCPMLERGWKGHAVM